MNILVIAPQPFLQERGTPIAVDLVVRSLSERGHGVDLLVYHEGRDVQYPGVRLHRIPSPPFVRNVRPGFSLKKVACDLLMFAKAIRLVRRRRPDVIHAVEESVYMAWFFWRFWGIPYIYDMDSSLPDQLVEALPALRPAHALLNRMQKPVVCCALLVAPVCEALANSVSPFEPRRMVLLRDVSLLETTGREKAGTDPA